MSYNIIDKRTVDDMETSDDDLLKVFNITTADLRKLKNDFPEVLNLIYHCLVSLRQRRELLARLIIIMLVLLLTHCITYACDPLTLSWDPNTEQTLAGYKLYYGHGSRIYQPPIDVGNVTTHAFTSVDPGQSYYFSVTAYDAQGNESDYSNEVGVSVRPDCTKDCLICSEPKISHFSLVRSHKNLRNSRANPANKARSQ